MVLKSFVRLSCFVVLVGVVRSIPAPTMANGYVPAPTPYPTMPYGGPPPPTPYPTMPYLPPPKPTLHPTEHPSEAPTSLPSASPSVKPTTSSEPSAYPSTHPSVVPTLSPSISPAPSAHPTKSSMPSPTPTLSYQPSVSVEPSTSPSFSLAPSEEPSLSESPSQSSHPSEGPTISEAPSVSREPSQGPSASVAPSDGPSVSLEPSISSEPSPGPTVSPKPSSAPSTSPKPSVSPRPSISPSLSPEPSASPTKTPEPSESPRPSNAPSVSLMPSNPLVTITSSCPGVFLNLFGISTLTNETEVLWRDATVNYMKEFLLREFEVFSVDIEITNVKPNSVSQDDMVMNVFDLFISVETRDKDSKDLPKNLVAAPFFTPEGRASYVRKLNNVTGTNLDLVSASSPLLGDDIPVAETGSPTAGPTSGPTAGPTAPRDIKETFKGVSVDLAFSTSPIPDELSERWLQTTLAYMDQYLKKEYDDDLLELFIEIDENITFSKPSDLTRKVLFEITISFTTVPDSTVGALELVKAPFQAQQMYTNALKAVTGSNLELVTGTSVLTVPSSP